MTLSGGARLGPYVIEHLLGAGGMGEVYKARDSRLDRTVAVKVLPSAFSDDPTLKQRLEREARTISALDHPNICALYDIGSESGTDFIVMQYLTGETLTARLQRGPLSTNEVCTMGAQIASALAAAHRHGIVHRDLKPGNIMIGRDGVRLLDFGLAKQQNVIEASDQTATTPLTGDRTIVGTLQYMSPEQLESRPVDARTDIFALGAVLYEMATGRRPFEGDSSASLITAIMTGRRAPFATLAPAAPPSLAKIVDRCLEPDPEDRWQSAGDLAYALRNVQHEEGTSTIPAVTPSRTKLGPWAIAAGSLIAAAAAGAALLSSRRPVQPPMEVRLSIVPPAGVEFFGDAANFDAEFAVSPDGTHVAFVAAGDSGNSSLWVRDLSSITPREIAGTAGARRPFWSPDGTTIGYVTPVGLARASLDGGASAEIPTTIDPNIDSSSTWTPDGRIIYEAPTSQGAKSVSLYIVPAAGGTARRLMDPASELGEQSQRFPVALPDGKHLVYLSWTIDAAERSIYLTSIEPGPRKRVVRSGFRPSFINPDLLVYVRDRTVVAQRFSLGDGQLAGDPTPIASGVALEGIPGQSAFIASTSGVIAYRSREREVLSELRRLDRNGRPEEIFDSGTDISVSLAPGGKRVALGRLSTARLDADRFPSNVWLMDLPRRVLSRLTLESNATDENPTWSPDGTQVAYARHLASGLAEVLVQASDGTGAPRVVASGPLNLHPIDWGADGTLLLHAYATRTGNDDLDLYTLAPGTSSPVPLIEAPMLQAQGQFSPDGRWIAYTSDESGTHEVYVRSRSGNESRAQISSNGGAQPRWRGDGHELFYVSPAGDVMAVPLAVDGTTLTPGRPITLFREPSLKTNNSLFFYGGAAGYDVTPDGKTFFVNRLIRAPGPGPIHVVINWRR